MTRKAFAWRAALAIAGLAVLIFGFPFLLYGVVKTSGCSNDTCGALGLVTSSALKPILFWAFLLAMTLLCVRRAHDARVPTGLALIVPLLWFADHTFAVFAGTGWAYAFSAGVLKITPPVDWIFALAGTVVLGFAKRDAFRTPPPSWLRWSILGTSALVVHVLALKAGLGLALVSWGIPAPLVSTPLRYAAIIEGLLVGLCVVAVVIANRRREQLPQSGDERVYVSHRIGWAFAAAAVATVCVLSIAFSGNGALLPLMFFTGFESFVLPTFVLYLLPCLAVTRLLRGRYAAGVALMLVAVVPFGLWLQRVRTVTAEQQGEAMAIPAIPTVALARDNRPIVIRDDNSGLGRCVANDLLRSAGGVNEVLFADSGTRFSRLQTRDRGLTTLVPAKGDEKLPDAYVLVRLPHVSTYAPPRKVPDIAKPTVEIYNVTTAGSQLASVTYTTSNRPPLAPPVLTTAGWFTGNNSVAYGERCRVTAAFVTDRLLQKQASLPSP